jgi:hypothetical protein
MIVSFYVEQINEKSERSNLFLHAEDKSILKVGDEVIDGNQLFVVVLITDVIPGSISAICHESFHKRPIIDDEMDLV